MAFLNPHLLAEPARPPEAAEPAADRLRLWQQFIVGRSAMTALFLLLLFIINGLRPAAPLRFLFMVAGVQFLSNGIYLYLWRVRDIAFLGYLAFTLEIALITLLILSLGPDGYIFLLAYLWPITLGSWLIGHRAVPRLTLLAALAYVLLFALQRNDFYFSQRLLLPDGSSQAMVLSLPYLAFTAGLVWALAHERERSEQYLTTRNLELARYNRGLGALVAAGEHLLGCLEPAELWTAAVRETRQLLGQVPVALHSRDGQQLRLERQEDMTSDLLAQLGEIRPLPGAGLAPATDASGRSMLLAASELPSGARLVHVALGPAQSPEGMISIALGASQVFDAYDQRLLRVLGHQLGTALANARLVGDLAHERNLLQGVLSRMSEGVFVADHQGRVLLANAAAAALLEVREQEALPADLLRLLAEAHQAKVGREHPTIECQGRVVQISLVALPSSEGGLDSTLYVARDITEGARIERMKTDFVNYASHEMRTPLTTIKMLVSLLRRLGGLSAKQNEYLAVIDSQVDRQHRLVINLLDVARLEAGKYDLPLEVTYPERVARSALDICRPLASAKAVELVLDARCHETTIISCPTGLDTVLTNLIGNAIKFTEQGGKVIVRCWHDAQELRLEVEDSGIGISPEQLEHLFEKYYTVLKPSKRGRDGTGLGLVIAESIVRQLGGRIEVRSQLGHGSCFAVVLPLTQPAEAACEKAV
jgi:signal transduction histidine kinase